MRCPECGSAGVSTDPDGETSCQACGLVISTEGFAVGIPGVTGKTARPRLKGHLGKTQRRANEVSATERRWIDAAQQTRRAGSQIQCPPDVTEEAARLLRRAQKAGITQGRDLRAMSAACLLASCRRLHLARTESQVGQAVGAEPRRVRSAYRALVRGLALSIPKLTAHAHMAQVSSRLGVPATIESEARGLLTPICGTRHAAGRNPLGWAAAALVLAARRRGYSLSVNQAADAARVSNSTVALRIRDLEELASGLPAPPGPARARRT